MGCAENCVVIAEGRLQHDGEMKVTALGMPPTEPREESLAAAQARCRSRNISRSRAHRGFVRGLYLSLLCRPLRDLRGHLESSPSLGTCILSSQSPVLWKQQA